MKDAAERTFACLLFAAAAPIILFLVCLIRLTSRGPGIYRQVRVGLQQREFEVFKLRTMRIDAEADGVARWCGRNDPRITNLGRILRRTHLDELPQLWNVVTGEMSLIGPRPERPSICDRLSLHMNDYYRRNTIKPGVTGLSQINLEPDQSLEDVQRKQVLDLHYIETANAWLDIRILMATGLRLFGIRGARVTRYLGLCRQHLLHRCDTTAGAEGALNQSLRMNLTRHSARKRNPKKRKIQASVR